MSLVSVLISQSFFFSASRRALSSFSFFIRPKNLSTSSMKMTGMDQARTAIHSAWFIEWMEKISLRKGTYTITQWSTIELAMAAINHGFTIGVIVNSELSSEIAFRAFSISITTSTDRERVEALTLPSVKYLHGF